VRARAGVAVAAVLVSACGASAQRTPKPRAASVVLLVMENKERRAVLGSAGAPYLTSLARRYGTAVRSFAIAHPSLPNYLALVSGSTHGVTSDCTACRASGPNLGTQLDAAGLDWRAYEEGLPRPCFSGATAGRYARKHDPFAYWGNRDCSHRTSFVALGSDLAAGRLPPFALVVPNLCHDMHDCSVATGDAFLRNLVPKLLRALGPHGYLVVTFDEGSSGRPIPTIVAGPGARRGATQISRVDHYGVLATIEDSFGLRHLGAAGDPSHGSLLSLLR
jgi:phosphatidylinositol-3-phosphatase